jgi:hypothetical protein
VQTSHNTSANQNVNEEAATGEDERGDLLIQGFWTTGTDCILDVGAAAGKREEMKRPPGMPRELPSLHTFPELSVDHGLLGREATTFAEMSRSQQIVVLINQKIGKRKRLMDLESSLFHFPFQTRLQS